MYIVAEQNRYTKNFNLFPPRGHFEHFYQNELVEQAPGYLFWLDIDKHWTWLRVRSYIPTTVWSLKLRWYMYMLKYDFVDVIASSDVTVNCINGKNMPILVMGMMVIETWNVSVPALSKVGRGGTLIPD